MPKPFKLRDGDGNLRDHVGRFSQSGPKQPQPADDRTVGPLPSDSSNGQAQSGRLPPFGPAEKKSAFRTKGG